MSISRQATATRCIHAQVQTASGLPGVQQPQRRSRWTANSLSGDDALTDASLFQQGIVHFVLPGYFEAMGTRLIAGRTFTDADNVPGPKLVIIDDQLAAMAFPNQSAVGKRLLARINSEQAELHEVIGVVQHQRHTSLALPGEEALFVTEGYGGFGRAGRWAVRTNGDQTML
jgi:putative ABC transport system permease protein